LIEFPLKKKEGYRMAQKLKHIQDNSGKTEGTPGTKSPRSVKN